MRYSGKRKYSQDIHLFETNIECHRRYYELLKEVRVWDNMGQYHLARETESVARQLLSGQHSVVNKIVKTEGKFIRTKKF